MGHIVSISKQTEMQFGLKKHWGGIIPFFHISIGSLARHIENEDVHATIRQ